MAAGHKTLLPALKKALKDLGGENILIVCGGVIPPEDYKFLHDNGADLIFGPGTRVTDAAINIVKKLSKWVFLTLLDF